VILPKVRDPRFITIRRGGTLDDSHHRLLAQWASECAEHVLPFFEAAQPSDPRPRRAVEQARAWVPGQAAVVAHVAAHELGAAAYAIKAARAAAPKGEGEHAGRQECRWERERLPEEIRDLVLDDQRLRNEICWSVFDC
jgi:hypothetical protein